MDFLVKHKWAVVGIVVGAIGGLLYWNFVGCDSGSCAITSKPLNSGAYGALMGGLLFSSFKKEDKKDKRDSDTNTNKED